jgi:hypothetical protein
MDPDWYSHDFSESNRHDLAYSRTVLLTSS